jgi:hypothetical protein
MLRLKLMAFGTVLDLPGLCERYEATVFGYSPVRNSRGDAELPPFSPIYFKIKQRPPLASQECLASDRPLPPGCASKVDLALDPLRVIEGRLDELMATLKRLKESIRREG